LGDRASLNSNEEEMPTRCNNGGLLILNIYQYFLKMFRVPLHPSSGGQVVLCVAANGVVFWLL
jgi:hypothetical protein